MRYLGLLFVVLGVACNGPSGANSGPQTYTLVLDDAEIVGAAAQGKPWCSSGAAPDISVIATGGGVSAQSSVVPASFHPTFSQPLLDADEPTFAGGFEVEVRGQCDQHGFSLGKVSVTPQSSAIEGGGITLSRFGGVYQVRFHFTADAPPGDPGYYDPGYYGGAGYDYTNYDYGYYNDPGFDDSGDF